MTPMPRLSTPLAAEAQSAKAAAFWCATVAGVLAGVAYTLSPTTVVFLLAMLVLFGWAQRDTSPRERRWVLGVLTVSLTLRLAALGGFFLFGHANQSLPVLIGDEWLIKWRSMLLLNMALGRSLAPTDYFNVLEMYGRTGLMNVLAYWQLWFGPAPYGAHLVNVTMWFAGAIVLYRTARRGFGPLAAIGGLVALLFMPTLFVWSISALKEPAYFFLTAIVIAGATAVFRARRFFGRIVGLMVVAIAMAAIEPIRSIALFVTAGGVVAGAGGWFVTRRAWLCAAAVVVVAAAGVRAQRDPAVEAQVMRAFRTAASRHRGNVSTVGYSYKLLDPRFYLTDYYQDPIASLLPDEAGRFAARALLSFVAVPLPWNAQSKGAIALIPQQVAWYVLAALAFVGIAAGWRRDAIFTWMLLGNIVVGGVVVSLFNGNVGTFVRFRDSVVAIIVWLSALGGCAVVEWAARRFSGESQHAHSR
jgi:hypothetical protein